MGFEEECLQAHNQVRAQHGVTPLKLNSVLSLEARKFAQELLKRKSLCSSDQKDLGENIYSVRSTNPNYTITGDVAVTHWCQNQGNHNYSQEPVGTSLSTGNFTQVIWKDSKELGVGFAHEAGRWIVVTRYSPAGNVRGQFRNNVLPPLSAKRTSPSLPPAVGTKVRKPSKPMLSGHKISAPSKETSTGSFDIDCLNQHNFYRSKHGVPHLKLDATLSEYSQEWADKLAQLSTMKHRAQDNYGENIFSAWSSDPNYAISGGKPVDAWYDEIKFYTFGREPADLKSGHFTQVVWKNCQTLGVGVAKRNGRIYVVCNYSPPGNYVGNFITNVPAPL